MSDKVDKNHTAAPSEWRFIQHFYYASGDRRVGNGLSWLGRWCQCPDHTTLTEPRRPTQLVAPLVSVRPETVAEAGTAVDGEANSEEAITVEQLLDHIWKLPKAKRKAI